MFKCFAKQCRLPPAAFQNLLLKASNQNWKEISHSCCGFFGCCSPKCGNKILCALLLLLLLLLSPSLTPAKLQPTILKNFSNVAYYIIIIRRQSPISSYLYQVCLARFLFPAQINIRNSKLKHIHSTHIHSSHTQHSHRHSSGSLHS